MNVSVVIPVFNEIESLPELKSELIDNLKAYQNWEVIFIDDGSSDGSTEWLIDIVTNHENFKLIQFYRNYGISAAFNEGF